MADNFLIKFPAAWDSVGKGENKKKVWERFAALFKLLGDDYKLPRGKGKELATELDSTEPIISEDAHTIRNIVAALQDPNAKRRVVFLAQGGTRHAKRALKILAQLPGTWGEVIRRTREEDIPEIEAVTLRVRDLMEENRRLAAEKNAFVQKNEKLESDLAKLRKLLLGWEPELAELRKLRADMEEKFSQPYVASSPEEQVEEETSLQEGMIVLHKDKDKDKELPRQTVPPAGGPVPLKFEYPKQFWDSFRSLTTEQKSRLIEKLNQLATRGWEATQGSQQHRAKYPGRPGRRSTSAFIGYTVSRVTQSVRYFWRRENGKIVVLYVERQHGKIWR